MCAIHAGSASGSITVTITTGAPLPIVTFGMRASDQPPPCLRCVPPPLLINHVIPRKPRRTTAIHRALSLRNMFLSAGGTPSELLLRAAYGGGRDVFRGGMAKCILSEGRVLRGHKDAR